MSETDRIVTASFINTLENHRTAQWRALSKNAFRVTAYYGWAIWLFYFGWLLLFVSQGRSLSENISIAQSIGGLVFGFFLMFNITPSIRIARTRPHRLLLDAPVTWRFSASRATAELGEWERRDYAWEILHSVDILPDGLMIMPHPVLNQWLPKHAFAGEEEFEQVCKWATERADMVRRFPVSRKPEWAVSLSLMPLVLAIVPALWAGLRADISFDESFVTMSVIYTWNAWRFFVWYGMVALMVFRPLARNRVGKHPAAYMATAVVLGLLLEDLFLPNMTHYPLDFLFWSLSGIAWLFAGFAHWWVVVHRPAMLSTDDH
jgi:hypothetical protein